ncbi:MAG TPA: YcbK family protein [Eoetvoesiella sp.]
MFKSFTPTRRSFLFRSSSLVLTGASAPFVSKSFAAVATPRQLAFDHTHTGEKISLIYSLGSTYVVQALSRLNHFLRDHYTGDVGVIDPQLFDVLHRIRLELDTRQSFHVISGYRCPATNNRLRAKGGGGVAKRSLHMDGKAIDVRLPGVPLAELRDAALSLHAGGVGFYPRDQFVHVDTGRVRSW